MQEQKIRILFPYIEAGMGHIVQMQSAVATFKEKYGDKVEIVETYFFKDGGTKHMLKIDKININAVKAQNRNPFFGRMLSNLLLCPIFGRRFASWAAYRFINNRGFHDSLKYMQSLEPDVVFSTHFSTNYFAMNIKNNRPLSVLYLTNSQLHQFCKYRTDYLLTHSSEVYRKYKNKRRYRNGRMVKVDFLLRPEAFDIDKNKQYLREKLMFEKDKFTIILAEGAYGTGKTTEICEKLLQKDISIQIIAWCGKNKEAYEHLKTLTPKYDNVTLIPIYNDKNLETVACADLFIGKSGQSSMSEASFFNVPTIVSNYSSKIERQTAKYFCKVVGSAIIIKRVNKIVRQIERFLNNPDLLVPYIQAGQRDEVNYGADKVADFLFEACKEVAVKKNITL